MADIFISYARDDRSKARLLADTLKQHNWSVWWDTRLQAGEFWDEVIERELNAAHCVVVLWSVASITRNWVRAEAIEGLQRGILVPVLIENVRPPLAFRLVQAESLLGWSGEPYHPDLDRLLAAIEHLLSQKGQRRVPTEQKHKQDNGSLKLSTRHNDHRKRWVIALLGAAVLAGSAAIAVYDRGDESPPMPLSPSSTQGTSGTSITPSTKPLIEPDQTDVTSAEQEIDGAYHVTGRNPDGTAYYGEANIKKKGKYYEIVWEIGENQKFYGAGSISGNKLEINWDGGIVTYVVQKDGNLEGRWANGDATETLVPK